MTTAVLIACGIIAGILNVAAAGGSLFSFLALSALGVPPLAANATNLAATPASFLGGIPAAWRGRRATPRGFVSAIAGTTTGVWLVNRLTADFFRQVAPVLLVVAALVLILQPWLRQRIKRRENMTEHPRAMAAWLFLTGVYAGGFGAGVGILVLVALACTTPWPWTALNASKNAICLLTSLVGLAAFSVTGLVLWPVAAMLAGSMAAGGLIGQWLTRHLPDDLLRSAVAVLAAFGAGHMAAS